jgi:ferredoxin-like protein FixX
MRWASEPATPAQALAVAPIPMPATPQDQTLPGQPSQLVLAAHRRATAAAAPVVATRPVASPLDGGAPDLLAPLGRGKRRLPAILFSARVLNMLVMLALIAVGLGVSSSGAAMTNVTSLLVWNVWWPFLVIAVFFAARLWCSICHLRLTADIFDRFGLQLKVPRLLKKYGSTVPVAAVLGIFIVHSAVVSYSVEDIPLFTAIFLIALMVYAAAVGLLFEKHSFCKYFCPLVGVLGNYTRVSPTELRSADQAQCKRCRDKACVKNCQNRLYMGTMDDEQQESCLLCMRCVKHCPHDNIRFSLRPYLRGLWQSPKRTVAGTLAVVVMLGIVSGEVGENWSLVDSELLFVPGQLTRVFGFEQILATASGQGFLIWETFWVYIVQPALILAACGVLAWLLVRRHKPLEHVQIYALGFIPLILSLHAAKLITAFNDAAGYLPRALTDPRGLAGAEALAAGAAAPSALIAGAGVWGWAMIAFVAGFGLLGGLYVILRIARVSFADAPGDGVRSAMPFVVALVALSTIAVLTLYTWLI